MHPERKPHHLLLEKEGSLGSKVTGQELIDLPPTPKDVEKHLPSHQVQLPLSESLH